MVLINLEMKFNKWKNMEYVNQECQTLIGFKLGITTILCRASASSLSSLADFSKPRK